MSQVKITDYFLLKNVSPTSLKPGMLISFNYKSPTGVNDKNPMVYVLEKRMDGIYGLNLHYNMELFSNLVINQQEEINNFLETEYFKKFPDKKTELEENEEEFNFSSLEQKDSAELKRKIPTQNLEIFDLEENESNLLRNYLYKRMTMVCKLVWKI